MEESVKEKVLNLLARCGAVKREISTDKEDDQEQQQEEEERWPMPEMVGFYSQTASLPDPTAAYQLASDPQNLAIKKLVCSPDLPLPAFSAQPQVPLNGGGNMFATTTSTKVTAVAALQCPPSDHHQSLPVKSENGHYACNVCPKTFTVPARLQRHMRTHTGEKPYECEICHKRFSVKENLSVHRRIHTKERPYKCTVCCRAFEHSGKLHRHMRIHTGERPHKCDVCEKTFIQSGQLVIHKRTHTGEKPYVCSNCHKGFTCSKQLKVHSRTHTGEKPYSCDICGKSFGYNHVLKLHQVAHYGEKVYKCTICNDTFNNKKNMELHIKSHSENNVSVVAVAVEPPTPPSSNPSSEMGASDKENSKSSMEEALGHEPNIRGAPDTEDLYYLYSRSGGNLSPSYLQTAYPASSAGVELLAAAASVRESSFYSTTSNQGILLTLMKSPQPVRHHPAYFAASTSSSGDDIRKRVEAALALDQISTYSEEERAVTPPSSNPVSPTPSSSTPPASPDPELSLPPRKRSRMIQKSMEDSIDLSPVRYTVIQYAGAS